MNLTRLLRRIKRFVERNKLLGARSWEDAVTDPRARGGRRWSLSSLLNALLTGMLTGCRTLRDVEYLTWRLASGGGAFGIGRRVPDTTLDALLRRLEPEELGQVLMGQVRSAHRSKSLRAEVVPLRVLAIDGKSLWCGRRKVHPECQRHEDRGTVRYHLRVLRACLISCVTRVGVGQRTVPAKTNEMGAFAGFFSQLVAAYGRSRLFEAVSVDAGMCSLDNARQIRQAGYHYIMALKAQQQELLHETRRLMVEMDSEGTPPEAETFWEEHKKGEMKRQLWRTTAIAGWLAWSHLQQVWRVRSVLRTPHGNIEVEDRYFITSLSPKRLNARQCLDLVRAHWGIENNLFGTLDREFIEDDAPWCRQGQALLNLGILRMLAYNLLSLLRSRRMRSYDNRNMAWRPLFQKVRDALVGLVCPIGRTSLLPGGARSPTT